jgi:hypothetical protein
MPGVDDLIKSQVLDSDLIKGVALGIGVAVLAPLAVVALSGVARPASRAAVKAGILLYEKGRETAAELGEVFDDLVAEAKYELEESRKQEEAAVAVSPEGEYETESSATSATDP